MKKKLQTTNNLIAPSRRPTALRFSPTAWAKLLFLRDVGDTEIGGFGIAPLEDLLFVEDVKLVSQTCTCVHVAFDDEAVANFFDDQVDAGRRPEEFGRIWIHTHPGGSPEPSGTDERTFERVFGRSQWALMFIIARGGQTYARLRFNVGPGTDVKLPVEVDYSRSFAGSDVAAWQAEYLANVRVPPSDPPKPSKVKSHVASVHDDPFVDDAWRDAWGEYMDFDHYQPEAEYGYIRDF